MKDLSLNYTAIGSLPFSDKNAPSRALDYVFEHFGEIPFWPQLPHFSRNEDMVLQFSNKLPGLEFENDKYFFDTETEKFALELEELYMDYETVLNAATLNENSEILDKYRPNSCAIDEFLTRLKNVETPKYVKGSITGPFTVCTSLSDKEGKCAFYDDILKDAIVKTLTLSALWQVKEFTDVNPATTSIIFMDEPSISQLGSSAFLTVEDEAVTSVISEIASAIRQFGGLAGIHCCGKTNWEVPAAANLNIINFDAFSFSQNLSTQAKKIAQFLENGGILAFGIVPTLDVDALIALDEEALEKKFEESLEFLTNKGIKKEQLLEQCFITPSCGCGSLSEADALKALEYTKKLSKKLQKKYKETK